MVNWEKILAKIKAERTTALVSQDIHSARPDVRVAVLNVL